MPVLALGGYGSQTYTDEVAAHAGDRDRPAVLLYASPLSRRLPDMTLAHTGDWLAVAGLLLLTLGTGAQTSAMLRDFNSMRRSGRDRAGDEIAKVRWAVLGPDLAFLFRNRDRGVKLDPHLRLVLVWGVIMAGSALTLAAAVIPAGASPLVTAGADPESRKARTLKVCVSTDWTTITTVAWPGSEENTP